MENIIATSVQTFTKAGTLEAFYTEKYKNAEVPAFYKMPTNIELALLRGYENGKRYCKIKCPINPLPIKGWFEVQSYGHMEKLLRDMGWTCKSRVSFSVYK